MIINYSSTSGPGLGQNVGVGYPPNASWSDPTYIEDDDSNSASIGFFEGGQDGDSLKASQFAFDIPPFAVIDGIEIGITGSNTECYGDVWFGASTASIGTLNTTYGGPEDLWGQVWSPEDFNANDPTISILLTDVSGGAGVASVQYITMTVYWHIDLATAEANIPTRFDYKVFDSDGNYLGDLPKVASRCEFSQDINSAGATLDIVCGVKADNTTTTENLLTESELDLLTEDEQVLLAEETTFLVIAGDSDIQALFKNSNRVEVIMKNYWYPNGKIIFKGQINKVAFSYGGTSDSVQLTVFSDGFDLQNYITRGFPFSYTTDVTQSSQNGYVTVLSDSKGAGWTRFGQSWRTGGAVTNLGALTLKLQGTASVTVYVYDAPNGNLLGSVTKNVANASAADVQFEFANLIDVNSSDDYFFGVATSGGQSIRVYKHSTSSTYANGSMYQSDYSGGSGGGSWYAISGDMYFITKSGLPTTTTTYTSDDPTTEMMSGILEDYNNRGGLVAEGTFTPTGTTATYTFVVASIYEALLKVLELSPTGFYSYIDLGTAVMDIETVSATPDFTVVRGRDVNTIVMALSIDQLKNYLLFTGGETAGVNLFRDYKDTASQSRYGLRTVARTDNRVTVSATADAIGNTFIEENANELQQTSITVLNKNMDITLLTPGKTIGFNNFGSFIDDLTLQIVRRDYTPDAVTLTLGVLPVRMNDEVQKILKGLLKEQTINNPSAPS